MMKKEQGVWEALTNAYEQNGIVLTLGAGVSKDSNIPSWQELLRRMVVKHMSGADEATFNTWLKNHFPLPAVASLLEMHCGGRDGFVNAVREALYRDFPFYNIKIGSHNRRAFRRFIQEGYVEGADKQYKANQTMRSIGALCMTRRPETNDRQTYKIVANPRIRAIVTLNMDALLQTYVNSFVWKNVHILRTVERASADAYSDSINVYHLHGYLHFAPGAHVQRRDATEGVILTEQDYYNFFNQPNSLFNYTFLYLLREYACLFIGLSMQDENIRRLLHYSKLEREQSLAYKRERSRKTGAAFGQRTRRTPPDDNKIKRHFVIMQRNKDLKLDQAQEETLGALGVNVIWVQKYSEIPDRLGTLYTSVPEDDKYWATLYGDEITGVR